MLICKLVECTSANERDNALLLVDNGSLCKEEVVRHKAAFWSQGRRRDESNS